MSGEYRIAAPRDRVWQGLNDPDVLARCIEGCQQMEKLAEDHFQSSVKAKVGPVSALFKADLRLEDVTAPERYVIRADVKGGAAGFGKGRADVSLFADGDGTLLRYDVKASVGGKLAQLGSRLIDATARKMADQFFLAFGREVSGAEPVAAGATAERSRYQPSGQWAIWAAVFIILGLVLLLVI